MSLGERTRNLSIVAALVINVGTIVGFAVSVTNKLDSIATRSTANCILLRAALVLSVEQSLAQQTRPLPPQAISAAHRIEQTFQSVACS